MLLLPLGLFVGREQALQSPRKAGAIPSAVTLTTPIPSMGARQVTQRVAAESAADRVDAAPIQLAELSSPDLVRRSISLGQSISRTARDQKPLHSFVDEFGIERRFTPGLVLVKFRETPRVRAINVPDGEEQQSRQLLAARGDVEFTELNVMLERQYTPNDSSLGTQWHHETIGSADAWEIGLATHQVKVAIVDWPFQMAHPDLADNVVAGWDVVAKRPLTSAIPGDFHSTLGAGLAAGVIDNATGIAGAGNAQVLPINIKGEIQEMYESIIWCADNGVRVVNISWDGCYSSTINQAAVYLKEQINGIVIMAGVNRKTFLSYPNQPLIFAIAATDKNDVQQTSSGQHIDFAAPGWEIYSTTTNSSYKSDSGTSYSAPLFAGMVAFVLAINPALGPEEIDQLFRNSAEDLGTTGRDFIYGFGRVHFGRAVREAIKGSPFYAFSVKRFGEGSKLTTRHYPGGAYKFFTTDSLPSSSWIEWLEPGLATNDTALEIIVPSDRPAQFFQLQLRIP